MAGTICWQDPEGQLLLKKLARKLVPQWTDGLRQKQDEVIGYLLDGEDMVYCTATGGGKSAAFLLPILFHQELAQNLSLYPHHPKLAPRSKSEAGWSGCNANEGSCWGYGAFSMIVSPLQL